MEKGVGTGRGARGAPVRASRGRGKRFRARRWQRTPVSRGKGVGGRPQWRRRRPFGEAFGASFVVFAPRPRASLRRRQPCRSEIAAREARGRVVGADGRENGREALRTLLAPQEKGESSRRLIGGGNRLAGLPRPRRGRRARRGVPLFLCFVSERRGASLGAGAAGWLGVGGSAAAAVSRTATLVTNGGGARRGPGEGGGGRSRGGGAGGRRRWSCDLRRRGRGGRVSRGGEGCAAPPPPPWRSVASRTVCARPINMGRPGAAGARGWSGGLDEENDRT